MTITRADPRNPYEAVDWGDAGALYDLLKAGASADERGTGGKTPLFRAYEKQDVQSVGQLLQHGADPNLAMEDGATAMHAAARHCDATGIVLRLIIAGGSLLIRDGEGRLPLDFARTNSSESVRELFADFTQKELDAIGRQSTQLSGAVRVSKPLRFGM